MAESQCGDRQGYNVPHGHVMISNWFPVAGDPLTAPDYVALIGRSSAQSPLGGWGKRFGRERTYPERAGMCSDIRSPPESSTWWICLSKLEGGSGDLNGSRAPSLNPTTTNKSPSPNGSVYTRHAINIRSPIPFGPGFPFTACALHRFLNFGPQKPTKSHRHKGH